ncbi:hypothetical protein BDR26DRAFT_929706 [Obelidium mucronatum]|nr:hypothetical protein BDR26DRAFT_929706 [Obelidium mucronatum]
MSSAPSASPRSSPDEHAAAQTAKPPAPSSPHDEAAPLALSSFAAHFSALEASRLRLPPTLPPINSLAPTGGKSTQPQPLLASQAAAPAPNTSWQAQGQTAVSAVDHFFVPQPPATLHSKAVPPRKQVQREVPHGDHQRFLIPPTSGCVRANKSQLKVLESIFDETPMPSAQMHQAIADRIGMTKQSVRNWFQNQRAKVRRSASEGDASAVLKVNQMNQIQHDRNAVKYAPPPIAAHQFEPLPSSSINRINVHDLI